MGFYSTDVMVDLPLYVAAIPQSTAVIEAEEVIETAIPVAEAVVGGGGAGETKEEQLPQQQQQMPPVAVVLPPTVTYTPSYGLDTTARVYDPLHEDTNSTVQVLYQPAYVVSATPAEEQTTTFTPTLL